MPFTPRHGRDTHLSIVIGGSTTQLSTAFDDSGLSQAVDKAETTTYGDNDKEYIPGHRGASFNASGLFDKTVEGVLIGQLAASTNPILQWGPEGNSTGRRKKTFGVVFDSLDTGAPKGDKVTLSFAATISGAVTSTTW